MNVETRRTLVIVAVLALGIMALVYVVVDGRSALPFIGLAGIAGLLLVWDVTKRDGDKPE